MGVEWAGAREGSRVGKDRRPSLWLDTVDDDLRPRHALDGSRTADVAILGAGFTGLWTAHALLRREPSLDVVLVEREVAGFGASGRNGGWCTSEFQLGFDRMLGRFGRERARALQLALFDTVDEVGRTAAAEGIPAQFRKGGALLVARGAHQRPALEEILAGARGLGLEDRYIPLGPAEVRERLRITQAAGAIFQPDCAVVHPGGLVRGLARAVERRGATIYEGTPVTEVVTGPRPALVTPRGTVRARVVVLAGEAYLAGLARFHREVAPIYSLVVATAPLPDEVWRAIGWEGHECVASCRYTVDYLSRTVDGRIVFGGRGAPYHYGSRIEDAFDRHPPTHAMLKRMARAWFAPHLDQVAFTHEWGGPLGMPRDWIPNVWYDPARGLAAAYGYTGQGVAFANLAGRILADLILGRTTALTELPFVGHRSPPWEPEPFRYLGIRYVQRALQRLDDRAERSGRAPTGRSLPERLARH
jgi:glycine/D-amino acid oxidase-like deaminating enzyme